MAGRKTTWADEKRHVSAHDVRRYQLNNAEAGIIHSPYAFEKSMLDLVTEGKEEELLALLEHPDMESMGLGKMSRNPRKQTEYGAVLGLSFSFRAAIEGGVDAYLAYDLNDLYLQRISDADQEQDYLAILQEGILAAVHEVQKAQRRRNASPHVEKAKNYVLRHLTEKIRLADVAEAVGLSPSYLSRHFHEVTGQMLQTYAQQERVRAAANMLRFSEYPVDVISEHLGFSSQSHFTEVFRKTTGETPAVFRKRYSYEK